jgi:hypothetical protein
LTVADCLKGKNEKVVELYQAYEAAVRACGEVRVHPSKSRIGFISRMTFAGAILKKDYLEAGMMLPYRSQSPRFHKFFPNGGGGVHSLKLTSVRDIDAEVRQWLREAYQCGMQQPPPPKLSKSPHPALRATFSRGEKENVETAPAPLRAKRSGRGPVGKIFYLHWNPKELGERIAPLRNAGHEVRSHSSTETVAKLGDFTPDVFVISLDRLPSHGRAYAGWFWESKKRQSIPIVFAGGEPDKVLVAKHQFPKAVFCSSNEAPAIIDALLARKEIH